jgi:hypothetical protein
MDLNDDKWLDVLQNIESGIKREYARNPHLTDTLCIFALQNAKIAIKQHFGFAKNENVASTPATRGIIDWCVSVGLERIDKINDLTLKEYQACLHRVKSSVTLHSKAGSRGYYDFIKRFVV